MNRLVRSMCVLTLACFWAALISGCAAGSTGKQPEAEPATPPVAQKEAPPVADTDTQAETRKEAPPASDTDRPPAADTDRPPAARKEVPPVAPSGKIAVEKLDDLPQHTYRVSGTVADLLASQERIAELAKMVRANVESDLATYEINDPTTLQRMYSTLLTVDLLEHDHDAALARVEQIRALEDKPAKKLTTGLILRSMIAARREVGEDAEFDLYRQAFERHLAARAGQLPWDVVQDIIQQGKGQMEIISEPLLMGFVQAQMEPVVEKNGELSGDMAKGVLGIRYMIEERLPLKEEIVAVYQALIGAHKEAKPDIWADRAVTLDGGDDRTPVLVAIWDSGTDPEVFEDRLFVNPDEELDGQDTDGNGYVDDVHGIAFDIHANRATGLLCPLGEAADRMPETMKHIKGFMDIQAAIDSPEATALKRHLSEIRSEEVPGFIEDLSLAGSHAHGTHVAGIVAAGNPFARLLIARLSYDHRMIPLPRTVEWGRRDAAKCRDTAEYFKQHGVRVVNMSWGEAQKDAESSLEKNGIGQSAAERREMAREVFGLQRQGLRDAIENAPEILFVCAAGNADNDVEFDEYIPSSFDLPNLLVVGAVDQAGEPTSFTSFGRTVQVYANGFEVDSYVPGGERMEMSGTSMASPHAANLAAKLLALNPTLQPTDVIKLIKRGADRKVVGPNSFLLLNPRRSVRLLGERAVG